MGTYSRRCFSSLNDFGWCLPEVDSLGRKKKKSNCSSYKGNSIRFGQLEDVSWLSGPKCSIPDSQPGRKILESLAWEDWPKELQLGAWEEEI